MSNSYLVLHVDVTDQDAFGIEEIMELVESRGDLAIAELHVTDGAGNHRSFDILEENEDGINEILQ